MQLSSYMVLLLVATCSASDKTSKIKKAFTSYYLIPHVLNTVPPRELSVRFSTEEVNLGNVIPTYLASVPPYIYYDADPNALYTIAIVDADWPSVDKPIDAQYLLALLVNTPGNNLVASNYLTPYTPVNPYPGSGYHRYVIILYLQCESINVNTPQLQNLHLNRSNFCIRTFAARYGLGEPIAANFFLSQLTVCANDANNLNTCSL